MGALPFQPYGFDAWCKLLLACHTCRCSPQVPHTSRHTRSVGRDCTAWKNNRTRREFASLKPPTLKTLWENDARSREKQPRQAVACSKNTISLLLPTLLLRVADTTKREIRMHGMYVCGTQVERQKDTHATPCFFYFFYRHSSSFSVSIYRCPSKSVTLATGCVPFIPSFCLSAQRWSTSMDAGAVSRAAISSRRLVGRARRSVSFETFHFLFVFFMSSRPFL